MQNSLICLPVLERSKILSLLECTGPKFHTLLSTQHLICTHFLTIASDKHMHLHVLTGLYGILTLFQLLILLLS